MNTQQVNAVIEEERIKFQKSVYVPTSQPLPPELPALFKKAIFAVSMTVLNKPAKLLREIIKKKEFSNFELATILNVIRSVPNDKLYKTVEEALNMAEQLEHLTQDYNIQYAAFETQLKQKEVLLSGPNSGMSIVN